MATDDLSCTLASWDLSTDQIKVPLYRILQETTKSERMNLGQIIEDTNGDAVADLVSWPTSARP